MPKPRKPEPVFLNIPYDSKFQDLYIAYVVGLTHLGLDVTATLAHPNQDRLAKIIELIEKSKFSIHDLSRIEASHGIPRFNMPLELGIALYRAAKAQHDVYVFESKTFRAQRSTSDINKMDPRIHAGTPKGVMSSLLSLFWHSDNPPTVPEMLRNFKAVKAKLPLLLKNAGSKSPFEKAVFENIKLAAAVERSSMKRTTVHGGVAK